VIVPWLQRRGVRRSAFVLANVLALALVYMAFISPVLSQFVDRDMRIGEQQSLLNRLRGVAAQEAHYLALRSDIQRELAIDEFLSGVSASAIAADLQTRMKRIVESHGALTRAMQGLPPKSDGSLKYSGVRIEMAGPLQSIYRTVYSIETSKPYLRIASASLKLDASYTAATGRNEPSIFAQLDVYGVIRPDAGAP
jgi:general secretion pathway protein M